MRPFTLSPTEAIIVPVVTSESPSNACTTRWNARPAANRSMSDPRDLDMLFHRRAGTSAVVSIRRTLALFHEADDTGEKPIPTDFAVLEALEVRRQADVRETQFGYTISTLVNRPDDLSALPLWEQYASRTPNGWSQDAPPRRHA